MARFPFFTLYLKKQFRAKFSNPGDIKIRGYDTETIDGKARLIAGCDGKYVHPASFLDCVQFLCAKRTRNTVGFFYNLKYDFQAILKWLPPDYWKKVFHEGRITLDHYDVKGFYDIFYIPQKFLKIQYKTPGNKTRSWCFFDISQYFGRMKLDNAAEKYLNKHKKPVTRDLSRLTMDDMLDPEIIEYCVNDAALARDLARWFADLCERMGLFTKNYASPAAISARYFSQHVKFPSLNRFISKKAYHPYIKYAWDCTTGAFINVFKRGYFERVYAYDIHSCYPYQMTQLPDISRGVFCYRKGEPDTDTYYMGWLKARVYINLDDTGGYSPPVLQYRQNQSNFFPIGMFETPLTLLEYVRLREHFDIDIIDGIYWEPTKDIDYFMRDPILRAYDERVKSDDPNVKYFLKIALNGIYGKFLEKHPEIIDGEKRLVTGNLFNPFYGSYILAGSRLQLFDALIKTDPSNLVACFTDSVMSLKPIDLKQSEDLGEWGLDHEGEALIIGCGVYSLRNPAGDLKTKMRGFHIVNIKADDESKKSRYDLFSLIESQPDTDELTIGTIANITPLQSIIQKIPADMNHLIPSTRSININFDTKRLWTTRFKRAKELLNTSIDSLPIDVNMFS